MSLLIVCGALLLAAGESMTPLPLPGGENGIGFDDLRFSPALGRLLVPAGRSVRMPPEFRKATSAFMYVRIASVSRSPIGDSR